jgi:hypothetical protein
MGWFDAFRRRETGGPVDVRARLAELGVILPDPPPDPLPPWLAGAEADGPNPIGPVP